jgi:hypothetical protein
MGTRSCQPFEQILSSKLLKQKIAEMTIRIADIMVAAVTAI